MLINQFVAGVLSTLFVEMAVILIFAIVTSRRK